MSTSNLDKPNTFANSATIIAAEHNSNFDTIYNDYNGNIANFNIKAGANISLSKLSLSDSATFSGTITFSSAPALPADTIDAITEIAAALKSGSDGTLMTGTAGTDGNVPKFNADGDIVDGGEIPVPLGAVIKGWVVFDGTDASPITPGASYNVSSVTKESTGKFTINWDTDFASVQYVVTGIASQTDGDKYILGITAIATGSVQIETTGTSGGAGVDPVHVHIMAIGTQ